MYLTPLGSMLFFGGLFVLTLLIDSKQKKMTTLWFAGAFLVSTLLAYIGKSFLVQVVAFIIVGVLPILLFRNLFTGKVKGSDQSKDSDDSIIGKEGVALSDISLLKPGVIRVCGQVREAVTADEDTFISKDTPVKVIGYEELRATVEKLNK